MYSPLGFLTQTSGIV
jgi:hypothetical protein